MSEQGDARRALLGDDLAREAREMGEQAPPPSPELLERLAVLMRRPLRQAGPDTQSDVA